MRKWKPQPPQQQLQSRFSVLSLIHIFYVPTIDQVSNGLRLALNLIRKYLPEGAFSRIYLDEQPVDARCV